MNKLARACAISKRGVLGFAVGNNPYGLAFDGTNIWATNSRDNNVTKLSLSGAKLGTFTVGTGPLGVAFDGANIWVANHGSYSVTKLQASNGKVLGKFAVVNDPWGVAF